MRIVDVQPSVAVSHSAYRCDSCFDTGELERMLASDRKFGFIIIDGQGTLFATVAGSVKERLGQITVELPKKHGRGGQSKNRFGRIRMERRHNYVRKVSELATQYFISNDRPNVAGLVLAGSAEFKDVLAESELLDPRLRAVILQTVDIAHPGDMGLNQAIELAGASLTGVKLVAEKKLLAKFMGEIAMDTRLFAFGAQDTMRCLEMGAVQTLIAHEDLNVNRYTITTTTTAATTTAATTVEVLYMTEREFGKHVAARPASTTTTVAVEAERLVDWFANHYKEHGCATLELVGNKTAEGAQFVRGIGGVGALLRYPVDLAQLRQAERQQHQQQQQAADADDDDGDEADAVGNASDDHDDDDDDGASNGAVELSDDDFM